MNINPYEALAHGIVLQAAKDYRKALKTLRRDEDDESALNMKKHCEQFFHSQWCEMLCNVDGSVVIELLEKAVGV